MGPNHTEKNIENKPLQANLSFFNPLLNLRNKIGLGSKMKFADFSVINLICYGNVLLSVREN